MGRVLAAFQSCTEVVPDVRRGCGEHRGSLPWDSSFQSLCRWNQGAGCPPWEHRREAALVGDVFGTFPVSRQRQAHSSQMLVISARASFRLIKVLSKGKNYSTHTLEVEMLRVRTEIPLPAFPRMGHLQASSFGDGFISAGGIPRQSALRAAVAERPRHGSAPASFHGDPQNSRKARIFWKTANGM